MYQKVYLISSALQKFYNLYIYIYSQLRCFDSLLLMLGPEGKKTKYIKRYANVISPIGAFFHFNISTTQLKVETVLIVFLKSIVKY